MLKTSEGASLESVLQFCDDLLGVEGHPDYPPALNGLQVDGAPGRPVHRVAAAVDASEAVLARAAAAEVDLLVVHHGLFWGGLRPVTGRHYRKLSHLIRSGTALYSVHLPLDAHPDVGNSALLARAMGLEVDGPFGEYKGVTIGWRGRTPEPWTPETLVARTGAAVDGPARVMGDGPTEIRTVAVVTGSGASFLPDAAAAGIDALVTGEAAHHNYMDACELGVHLVLAGHYATETFGVRALVDRIAERFGVESLFIDDPSGL